MSIALWGGSQKARADGDDGRQGHYGGRAPPLPRLDTGCWSLYSIGESAVRALPLLEQLAARRPDFL